MRKKSRKKNCLSCKYEPDWGKEMMGMTHRYRSGACKWKGKEELNLPKCYSLLLKPVFRFSDNSGIYHNCPTWEKKL